jgi:hypothetical protein
VPNATEEARYEYMLLGRLQTDCDYYLGNGNRCARHLWALGEQQQIAKMKELYEGLPVKPEWLTWEQILDYERQMVSSAS